MTIDSFSLEWEDHQFETKSTKNKKYFFQRYLQYATSFSFTLMQNCSNNFVCTLKVVFQFMINFI